MRTEFRHRPFLILILVCSAAGVVLGGSAGWAEGNSCLQATLPTQDCLTKSPIVKAIEGMAVGLVAGMGAAVGATVQVKRH